MCLKRMVWKDLVVTCAIPMPQVREVRGRNHTRGGGRAEGADIVVVARKGWQVQEGGVRKGQS